MQEVASSSLNPADKRRLDSLFIGVGLAHMTFLGAPDALCLFGLNLLC